MDLVRSPFALAGPPGELRGRAEAEDLFGREVATDREGVAKRGHRQASGGPGVDEPAGIAPEEVPEVVGVVRDSAPRRVAEPPPWARSIGKTSVPPPAT